MDRKITNSQKEEFRRNVVTYINVNLEAIKDFARKHNMKNLAKASLHYWSLDITRYGVPNIYYDIEFWKTVKQLFKEGTPLTGFLDKGKGWSMP